MTRRLATTVVFVASASVLMLEILAGRLMAPYVGVSLETFTGIIGTMLAGIAAGSAIGGRIADRGNPLPAIAAAYGLGGVLAWVSVPIVNVLGPGFDGHPVSIVVLTMTAFFAPAAVLSAVTPLAAKARLDSLEHTGSVVGDLSAAGTAGALVGTFLTGFVLVAALPSRWIVIIIGALLVACALALALKFKAPMPPLAAMVVGAALLGGAVISDGRCETETAYSCVRIEVDADNPSGRSVYINFLRNSYVDLEDPTNLDFRYMRLIVAAIDGLDAGAIRAAHIGGAGATLPRYIEATRPGSTQVVLEIDGQLMDLVEDELGLEVGDDLRVVIGDARAGVEDLATDGYDVIVGDAFSGITVPWHLTTTEIVEHFDRVLVDDGIYVMNVIDGGGDRFVKAQLATLGEHFDHLALFIPAGGVPSRIVANHVLIASDAPIRTTAHDADDGTLLSGDELDAFVGNARVLRDDFAPVDQLTKNG